MRAYKNFGIGLLIFVLACIQLTAFLSSSTSAQSLDEKALDACAKNFGDDPEAVRDDPRGKACIYAYKVMVQSPSQATFDKVCENNTTHPDWDAKYADPNSGEGSACIIGRGLGSIANGAATPGAPVEGNKAKLTDAEIEQIADQASICQVGSKELKEACINGFREGYKENKQGDKVCTNTFKYTSQQQTKCQDAFSAGQTANRTGIKEPDKDSPQKLAEASCKEIGGPKTNDACEKGYVGGYTEKKKDEVCKRSNFDTDREKVACEESFDVGKADKGNGIVKAANVSKQAVEENGNGNSCESGRNFELNWLFCPILGIIGDFADSVFGIIKDQLDFNINENLTDNVHQAWSIFRTLSTVLLVIILLVMIISQAIGGGPFEAYTIRKILPKTVFAIILIQLSWVVFRFFIILANAAGNGIQDLMAVPFGGQDKLELDNLLGALGEVAPGVAGLAGFIAVSMALIINPWGAVMGAFLIFMAIVTAMAVLLFRQALIIGCMILAPIALVLWILPGTQTYWKMWWTNFTRALMLFPLIAGMVIVGRIFAWIVGAGDGETGALDIFAIIVGYFGPFFLLPKAWGWGGQLMSLAARGVDSMAKKPTEMAKKEFQGLGERRQGKWASKYDPNPDRMSKRMRAFRRLQSGNVLPTERGRRTTILKGNQWKKDRNEEALALNNRLQERGLTEGYTHTDMRETIDGRPNPNYRRRVRDEPGLKAAKQSLVDMVGYDGDDEQMRRAAEMAVEELLRTQSYYELQNSVISEGKYAGMKVQDTPHWQRKLQTNPDMWGQAGAKRPDTIPTVTSEEYGSTDDEIKRTLRKYAPQQLEDESDDDYKQRIDRYLDTRLEIIKDRQRRLGSEPARLDAADRLTKALVDNYADASHTPQYAEGFWDEVNLEAAKGNTAAQGLLIQQFKEVAAQGQAGLNILSPLATGPLRQKVNTALGGSKDNDVIGKLIRAAKSTDQQEVDAILKTVTLPGEPTREVEVKTEATQATESTPTGGPTGGVSEGPVKSQSGSAGQQATTGSQVVQPGTAQAAPGQAYVAGPAPGTYYGAGMTAAQMMRAVEEGTKRANLATRVPNETHAPTEYGTLVIPHVPGEGAPSPGGVYIPQERRTRDDKNTPGSGNS